MEETDCMMADSALSEKCFTAPGGWSAVTLTVTSKREGAMLGWRLPWTRACVQVCASVCKCVQVEGGGGGGRQKVRGGEKNPTSINSIIPLMFVYVRVNHVHQLVLSAY